MLVNMEENEKTHPRSPKLVNLALKDIRGITILILKENPKPELRFIDWYYHIIKQSWKTQKHAFLLRRGMQGTYELHENDIYDESKR